jgi:hypothetical protein
LERIFPDPDLARHLTKTRAFKINHKPVGAPDDPRQMLAHASLEGYGKPSRLDIQRHARYFARVLGQGRRPQYREQ